MERPNAYTRDKVDTRRAISSITSFSSLSCSRSPFVFVVRDFVPYGWIEILAKTKLKLSPSTIYASVTILLELLMFDRFAEKLVLSEETHGGSVDEKVIERTSVRECHTEKQRLFGTLGYTTRRSLSFSLFRRWKRRRFPRVDTFVRDFPIFRAFVSFDRTSLYT